MTEQKHERTHTIERRSVTGVLEMVGVRCICDREITREVDEHGIEFAEAMLLEDESRHQKLAPFTTREERRARVRAEGIARIREIARVLRVAADRVEGHAVDVENGSDLILAVSQTQLAVHEAIPPHLMPALTRYVALATLEVGAK